MKVKVAQATEVQLDWMVAKAEGYLDAELAHPNGSTTMVVIVDEFRRPFDMRFGVAWRPSEKWAQGGPIIEREFIEINVMSCGQSRTTFDTWLATLTREDEDACEGSGPTILIAAMRCYVASKLEDVVDVPEELT